ncbi:hypothetical protein MY10362_002692 [Beauveria mimosiformis]
MSAPLLCGSVKPHRWCKQVQADGRSPGLSRTPLIRAPASFRVPICISSSFASVHAARPQRPNSSWQMRRDSDITTKVCLGTIGLNRARASSVDSWAISALRAPSASPFRESRFSIVGSSGAVLPLRSQSALANMDTVDAETNVLLVSNIASVAYRFYEPSADSKQTFFSNALGIETTLREQGRIVSFDATRRGLWYFHIRRSIGAESQGPTELGATAIVNGQSLVSTKHGSMEPYQWHKSLAPEPPTHRPNQTSSGHAAQLQLTGAQQDHEATAITEQTEMRPSNGLTAKDIKPENGRAAQSTISIPWPGSLCFRKKAVELSATNRISDTIVVGHDETHDPLGDARGWLSSANEREERISKRHAERSAAGAKENSAIDTRLGKINAPSPVTMRRPSTTGGNAVYPTPPDAIQNLNGVTPSMDGNLSSPGHPLSVVADIDIDCEPPGEENSVHRNDDEMTEAADGKPLRSDNNLLSEAETMFEDMGPDVFGDNDITEADFSFFDEQPDEMGMDMSFDSIKGSRVPSALPIKAEEPVASASINAPPSAESAVFAKPELKHARSSQPEDAPQRGRDHPAKSVKRGSSPFDPDSVFKRLRAATSQRTPRGAYGVGLSRGFKVFEKVDFDSKMPMLNKKYEHGGLFDFVPNATDTDKLEPGTLPKTDYLRRHGKTRAKQQADSRRPSIVKSSNDPDTQLLDHQLLNLDGDISDGDDSSSDSDIASNLSVKEPVTPVKSTVKQSILGDDDAASYVTTGRDQDLAEEPDEQLGFELPRLSLLDGPDTSLFRYFTDPEPLSLDISLSDEDMIQVAQLVAEQAAAGSLSIFSDRSDNTLATATEEDARIEQLTGTRCALQALRDAASSFLGTISPIGLKTLLEVQDGSLTGQGNRVQPRQVPSKDPNSEPIKPSLDDGVLLYGVDQISTAPDATMMGHGSALLESMETLSSAMSDLEVVDTNVVVYFMYSTSNPGTIVEACMAFQRFFESYRRTLVAKRESAKNEIVLQLVSADAISSSTSMVITPSSELVKLCMETYDRCTLFGGNMPAPAIRLEQPLPRIIDFKLSPAPSSSLARENSCIHIAYARSIDGRWVTAAWTDDRGNEQATAAYCLGHKDEPETRTMNDVAHEIWQTTVELISSWKVHYRIIMTKCGPTDEGEIDFWVDLARTEMHASVTMIVMTVETNPSLQLVPAPVRMSLQPLSIYTTPVSTPQANIVSPEASAAPATPARDTAGAVATPGGESNGDAEVDSVLADVMDQTWGAIVNHRLNNTVGTTSIQPALISGYLIKRTGPKAEDVPSIMEVNLVYTEASARTYEPLLREMLSYFRGLGTLARARGVVDRVTDVRPWHVAAAEKALRALYILM